MKRKHISSGFKVPESYFSDLEDRVLTQLETQSLPKTSGFKTPDGYFGRMEEEVFTKAFQKEKQTKVISLFTRNHLYYAAGIAACIVLIVSIFKNDPGTSVETINLAAIETYIEAGNADIDSYDVVALLTDEEFENLLIDTQLVSEESLQTYLMENIDDMSLLIE
ncbi:hypothetical protein [Constantimarinum furrinae]|uniref:Uncharacterized protein n=1 Tax=Constantimarinum furrinae TaxID=2562285 RepID=A0A7G8PVY2_9FLAO|nr:hypothetical protein [Constantimarinum furrinae]QNJ98498.1 hypothetical protein ALE3EI_1951 [Constantimarinum furrinae]